MKIYGVALLAFCYLIGKLVGSLLGKLLDINGDVGGVGFAMFVLILLNAFIRKKGWLEEETEKGILFWSSMYIPVVIAMASILNVKAALSGGWLALIVGLVVTLSAFFLVPVISKIGQSFF
jgi:malonate transporter MadL subunit